MAWKISMSAQSDRSRAKRGVFLDEAEAGVGARAHQALDRLAGVGGDRLGHLDAQQRARPPVHRRLLELAGSISPRPLKRPISTLPRLSKAVAISSLACSASSRA
jgi:hypothetical protein